jgi:hypothetical protein
LSTVAAGATRDGASWDFEKLHERFAGGPTGIQFPYADRLGNVLPWWGRLDELKEGRQ